MGRNKAGSVDGNDVFRGGSFFAHVEGVGWNDFIRGEVVEASSDLFSELGIETLALGNVDHRGNDVALLVELWSLQRPDDASIHGSPLSDDCVLLDRGEFAGPEFEVANDDGYWRCI